MSNSTSINLKLNFNQVLELVRQLPAKQQQKLLSILSKEEAPPKELTQKEQEFLDELNQAVEFVNNYPKKNKSEKTFNQILDAL